MENYSQALLIFQFWYNPRGDVIYVWYMDDSDEDQRFPQHHDPKKFVSLDKLAVYGYKSVPFFMSTKALRIHNLLQDFFEVYPEKLPNYEEKIKSFFENTSIPIRRFVTVL
ncbi:hypothetical protein MTR67_022935 [Solanum verrucosum]|uniref:Uncharacterized protein n=1 Tax=Solanum verrucosum TaxID=315347 RepID=A0AAF0QYS2_SOLVR|nr:hypothetical protein MTR67_022935 [Solanum verrucosum]